jgi:dihydroanticapsin dehydrogenase
MTENGAGRLYGRVAIVVGASKGIGRAIAVRFASEGAQVVAGSRDQASLEDTAKLGEGRIATQACDVRDSASVRRLVDRAVEEFGGLDVMCNNAGVAYQAPLVDTPDDMWNETMEINVRGAFYGCKYAVPAMQRTGRGGSIINVGSTNSFSGEHGSTAYVASKGAVLMLTKNAAAECAEYGIRVNLVCPGATDTSMARGFLEQMGGAAAGDAWMRNYQPLTGLIDPEAIAGAALFLASDDSRGMTGTPVIVDGGLLASWDHNA